MHELESVVASVNVYDELRISFSHDKRISVRFDSPEIGENNSAVKALEFLQSVYPFLGADVYVKKGIPVAGGLGGSSADAAAVIKAALNFMPQYFGENVIGESVCVGSDVPALIGGGCSVMSGTGETVTPVALPELHLVISNGGGGVKSGAAYREFDKMYPSKNFCPTDTNALICALKAGDTFGAALHINNALTLPAIKLCPDISHTLDAIKAQNPAAVFMTGSGSCCCGLFESELSARAAAESLRRGGLWAQYAATV